MDHRPGHRVIERAVPILRPHKLTIRLSSQDLERVRIAAAKQGLAAASWVYVVAVDAALRAA